MALCLKRYKPIQRWDKRERKICKRKYVCIKVPEHPKARGGWVFEHRLVIERKIGRVLEYWETIHHISENKSDNREINLFLCTRQEHDRAHRVSRLTPIAA